MPSTPTPRPTRISRTATGLSKCATRRSSHIRPGNGSRSTTEIWENIMIKLVSLIAKKPGITREEFIEHYEKQHSPMSIRLMPQIAKYVRNYPTAKDNLHYAGMQHVPT